MSAAILSRGFRNLIGSAPTQGDEYQYLLPHHLRTHNQSGAQKRDAHFYDIKKRNQERAALEEKISETALCPEAHKQLVSKSYKWRRIELAAVISSLIGLIIAVFDYELAQYYDGYAGIKSLPDTKIFGDGNIKIPEHAIAAALELRHKVPFAENLRWANFVSCVVTIALLTYRNIAKTKWTNNENSKEIWLEERGREPDQFINIDDPADFADSDEQNSSNWCCGKKKSGKNDKAHDKKFDLMTKEQQEQEKFQLKMQRMITDNVPRKPFFTSKFVLECISQMIFPYPFWNTIIFMPQLASSHVDYVPYFFSDFVTIIMFVRLYALIRHWERYHTFSDLYAKKICRHHGVWSGRMFTFKCELSSEAGDDANAGKAIVFLFVFSVCLLSFILRVFELPFEQNAKINSTNLQDYGSAIWLTIITMTTVGYGDIYPQTSGGQVTGILIALWGAFVISLLIMITAEVFEFKTKEKQAVFYIKQSRSAAKSIKHALQFFVAKKHFYVQKLKEDPDFDNKSTFLTMVKGMQHNGSACNLVDDKSMSLYHAVKKHTDQKKKQGGNSLLAAIKAKVGDKVHRQEAHDLAHKMNEEYRNMLEALGSFSSDRQEYDSTFDANQLEQINSLRVIKKEVLDLNDLVDKMSGIVISQHNKIEMQKGKLSTVRDVLRGYDDEGNDQQIEEQPASGQNAVAGTGGDDWVLPDLYSLRRSPYYQKKICQRQLNAHILNTRNELIKQLTNEAKSEFDLRDCLDKLRQQYAMLGNAKRQDAEEESEKPVATDMFVKETDADQDKLE